MPVSIISNVSSQYAQQAIQGRSDRVANGTQRLSSGLRVFTASEDPAAVTVGNSLRIENAALGKAQINAASGVSMLQITDGALSQIGDIAIRMKALATQASSGQLADGERQSINIEFQALKNEIGRIAGDTEFNGVHMLAGSADFTLQGAHDYAADGIVGLNFEMGGVSSDATFRYSYDSATEQFTVSRTDQGFVTSQTLDVTVLMDNFTGAGQNLGPGQTMDLSFNALGVRFTLGSAFDRTADILPTVTDGSGADINFAATFPTYTPGATGITIDGVAGLVALAPADYSPTTGDLTLDLLSSGAGGTVTLAGIPGIRFAVNGGPVGASGAATADLVGDAAGLGVGVAATVDVYVDTLVAPGFERIGTLNLGVVPNPTGGTAGTLTVPLGRGMIAADYQDNNGSTSLTYMVGSGVQSGQDLIVVTVPAANVDALALTTLLVSTQSDADLAIDGLNAVLTTINQTRAQIGAQQARLEFVGRNLTVANENNEAARSALMDADVPSEITSLTNDQAMLEVGISMLSQANQLPQMLLQMLRQG